MTRFTPTRRHALALTAAMLATGPAFAAPRAYQVDKARSEVRFTYGLAGTKGQGTMLITHAAISLDFAAASRSSAEVVLDAQGAKATNPLITDALKSPEILHTDVHPQIRFVSRKISAQSGGARMQGDVTLRGVTKSLTLDAQIYRPPGSAEGEYNRLTIHLTGSLSRSAFGASGYPKLVDDQVGLAITARLLAN
ncbi:MAG: YceI family protein [Mangrovicoccus sp.]